MPKKDLLARKHEQALVRRIAVILVFCLAGIALVIYYAIPAMVKIADVWDTTRNANVPNNKDPDITIPLQRPNFNSLPFEATNSAVLTLTGKAESGLTVHLSFNGAEKSEVVADNSGSFIFANVSMNEGTNTFSAYAQDSKGRKSSPTETYSVILDTREPKLELNSPNNGETYGGAAQAVIDVKGKTDEATEVYINGSRGIINADGTFAQKVRLQGGENTITVYAKDDAGNKSVDVSRRVTYNP